ncbi:Rossmann fold nucleotide-binding protein Smf possibly involved in DNA uptake [Pseudoalteromonas luteoviolacea B = ATCC 29581]|nr:Rossmann fold nucleotide-binding protein Smf possibly involved in DNA uptake [Pseudoalteromonas luteoviolacea B = ATCC 29581]
MNFLLSHYLVFSFCPGFGARALCELQQRYSLDDIFALRFDFTCLTDAQRHYFDSIPEQKIQRTIERLAHLKIDWVGLFDPDYPRQLREISSPPLVLYYRGNANLLNAPQLAIVGTRNPTLDGKRIAYELSAQCAQSGLVITSGMALGIDACAHEGALNAEQGTVAVLGTGVDEIYPKRNRFLYDKIVERGLIVSEFLPSTKAKPEHFPRRNRIVSGLSLGTLVVEAEIKSGSLITAKYALEQNREVFAVPSSVRNPMAKGCHLLIKQGAKLVECDEDILSEFALFSKNQLYIKKEADEINAEVCPVLNNIGFDVVSLDTLQLRTQWPIDALTARLLDLELEDKVAKVMDGYVKVARG